jgi:hypothetical protein
VAGVLEHCREADTNLLVLRFSGRFRLTTSVRRRRLSRAFLYSQVYIAFLDAAITENYTSEYRERFEISVYVYFTEERECSLV